MVCSFLDDKRLHNTLMSTSGHIDTVSTSGHISLDHFQSAVASSDSRHSLVVRSCAAGSGKSTTLAIRAGALIASGLPPERTADGLSHAYLFPLPSG